MKAASSKPRVLLINPNTLKPAVAPIGLDLIAGVCEKAGVEAALLDLAWERAPLKAIARAADRVNPHLVGVSVRNVDDCYYASQAFLLPAARRYVRAVKKATDAPIVVGGVGFSAIPGPALEYLGADFGIRGDGEDSFPELAKRIAGKAGPEGVPGLFTPGSKVPPPARASAKTVADIIRGAVDQGKYFRLGGQAGIETQRGCPGKCTYCADPAAKGKVTRFRDPESVAWEMGRMARMGVNVFHLCDSELNIKRSHVEGLCKAVIKAGLEKKITWYAYAKPKPMDDDLARLLKSAGCVGIDFGADSASAEVLQSFKRDFDPGDLETCARALKRAGIVFMYDLLLGGPAESRKTLEKTIGRVKKIRPHRVGVSFGVRLFPQTELGESVIKAGPLAENPSVKGVVQDNQGLLRPVFFVSEKLGPRPEAYLQKLIGDDPIFLFASSEEKDRNYNYNDNAPLCRAIRKGARGAFWDIIRRGV